MTTPLSVGLNLLYLTDISGGTGSYARELTPSLLTVEPGTRITAFVNAEAPKEMLRAPWADEVEWVVFPFRFTEASPWNSAFFMAAQWTALPVLARTRGLDVVHGVANIAPVVSPGIARVVTLHDVLWIHHRDTMTRRETAAMKVVASASARAAHRVITVSNAAKEDIVRTLRLDAEKIDVTPLGITLDDRVDPVGEGELRRRFRFGPGPVVLTVAWKRKHKNLASLIRALAALPEDVQLALPGTPTPHEQELKALARELGVADRVHFLDWVSDAELAGLYRMAACFVLPSLQEGFGLPVLDAMARGVPVACSNTSSLPEVAGDVALYFDPLDVGEIAQAVRRLLADRSLAAALVARGYERCRAFTWEATARATLASYRRAIEGRGRRATRGGGARVVA